MHDMKYTWNQCYDLMHNDVQKTEIKMISSIHKDALWYVIPKKKNALPILLHNETE